MKKFVHFLLLVTFALLGHESSGQSTNDYRSANDGDWNSVSTWERWNGTSWQVPTAGQGTPNHNDGAITIISAHTVTVTENVAVDEVTIQAGAQVTVNSGVTWRINNGVSGDDLVIDGTVENFGTINYRMPDGISQVGVNGIVINQNGAIFNTNNVEWTYNAGSTYVHARNGAAVPKATWNTGSTCEITGITDNNPGNLGQSFANFVWNCPDMSENIAFGDVAMEVKGNLEIIQTGSFLLRYNQDQLTIGGDLAIGENANFRMVGGTNSCTFNVGGGLKMDGGTFTISAGQATGILNITGDFSHSAGTIAQTGAGQSTINLEGTLLPNGSGLQAFSGGGTFTGNINFNILSGAGVSFSPADLSGSSGLLSNSGTMMGNTTEANPLRLPEMGLDNTTNGIIAPGSSVGTLTIIGDFTSNGTLNMEIEEQTMFDRIIVTGTATVNGTLDLEFVSYTPNVFDDFGLITATFYAGSVSTVMVTPASISGTYDDASGIFEVDAVLPINLLSFTGRRSGEAIQLNWRTATEQNNDYMAVERAGHDFQFAEIGRVAGAGTTTEPQAYEWLDEQPLDGANYYRLRQVDIDGTVEYHPVIYVDFIASSQATSLRVFPNPAKNRIRAAWEAGSDQSAELRLFDAAGQLIRNFRVNGENGTYELALDDLTAGVYYLHLQRGTSAEHIRFVKH